MVDVVTTVQTLMDLTTAVVLVDLNCHQTIIHVKVTNSRQYCVLTVRIIIGTFYFCALMFNQADN